MNIRLFAVSFWSFFLLTPLIGARTAEDMATQTRALYEHAMEQYGVAMGERDPKDPATSLILRQVAELVCLLGDDVAGCLDASGEAGRSLGPYFSSLEPGKIPLDASYDASLQFLEELHRNSEGLGRDESLASEALGHIMRIQADAGRQKLAERFASELKRLLSGGSSIAKCVKAVELAKKTLDQDSVVKAGMALCALLESGKVESLDDVSKKSLGHALKITRDTLKILGKDQAALYSRVLTQCERFDSKRLAAPDLDFPLTQSPADFKADLGAAQKQLATLARGAALRSRVSVLFTYLASYVGVVMQKSGAARPLRGILETISLTDPWMYGRALGLLGLGSMQEGDFWAGADLMKASAKTLSAFPDASLIRGIAMANGAQAWFYLGEYSRAAEDFSEAADLFKTFPELRAKALAGRTHSMIFAGSLDGIDEQLDEAKRLVHGLEKNQQGQMLAKLKLDRALFLLASGKKAQAIKLFEQLLSRKHNQAKWSDNVASIAYTNLAEIMNDSGKFARALSLSKSAQKLLDPLVQADAMWQAFCEEGRALDGLGKKSRASRAFDKSMDMVESLRSKVGAEGARRSFSAAKKRLYANAISSLISSKRAKEAFFVSERARGRAFLDMLGERQIQLGDQVANKKLKAARMGMLRALPPMRSDFLDRASSAIVAESSGKKQHRDKVFAHKSDPAKPWLSLVTVNPARVKDVQRLLRPTEGLISFFHDGKRLEVFLVSAHGFYSGAVDVSKTMLTRRTEDLLRKLRRPDGDDSKVRKKAKRLWDLTLAPMSRHLAGLESLVIVPWGPLHYIPFQTLYDGSSYAVDRWQITVSPSASAFMMIRAEDSRGKKSRSPGVFALGNPVTELKPLPAAGKEALLLGKLFAGATVRTGRQATKNSVLTEAVGSAIVHLASHGVFLPKRPMDSYLALSGDGAHGTKLSAMDVLGLDLSKAKLVVLSACSSGKVKVADGEEIVGLTRAFLQAGTGSLVASLWPISDSASMEFVRAFYGGIKKGLGPRQALSRAQRAMKSRAEFSHPFYWAPFELVGL